MFDYNRQYGVEIKVARIFNTDGPRMAIDDGRVVTNFVAQALRGEPLTIYGDGSQTRSFCYGDYLINGLPVLFDSPKDVIGPVNVGNPKELTILQLSEIVKRLTNSNSEIVANPLPQDDPKQRKPDITKAKEVLGWSPEVALEDGLVKTIEYLKTQI
jgi:UDP-glucuronate decarboxylase